MTPSGRVLLALALLAWAGPACHKAESVATPSLAVDCGATPSAGTAPLAVAFKLNVAGAQGAFTVAINYGDGTQGSDPDTTHVYGSAGTYAASLTVSTATQSARCSSVVTVAAPAPTPAPTNQPALAEFHTNPASTAGKAPFTVQFNMCQSSDPDGDKLLFKMDLDGNGSFEHIGSTGADCRLPQTYAAGTYTATICVTDVNCPSWPDCRSLPPNHPYQCKSYSVVVSP